MGICIWIPQAIALSLTNLREGPTRFLESTNDSHWLRLPKNQRSIVGDPIDIILGLIQEQVGWEPNLEGDDEDMMIKKAML